MQPPTDGQAAHELGNQSVTNQIFGLHMRQRVSLPLRSGFHLGVETERLVTQAPLDNLLQPDKCAAANEKNVRSVDREEFLVWMLAAALGRNVGDRSFQNLQERLLHTFARNVAGDRRVFVLAANLVDLVDVDYALLRAFDVAVGGLKKFQDDVLDVFAHITGFGQGRSIDDCERNAEHARQRLGQQSLAGARRTNQDDIRFLNFDVGAPAGQLNAFVMLIDGDGQTLLGFVLADNVFVEKSFDLARLGQRRTRGHRLSLLVVADDLVADVDTLIADIHRGPGNELLHFILRLTAERAAQRVVSSSYHSLGNSVRDCSATC